MFANAANNTVGCPMFVPGSTETLSPYGVQGAFASDVRLQVSLPLYLRSLKEIWRRRRRIIEKRTHHRHQHR